MNDEVLKILNEPDRPYDSPIDMSFYDVDDVLEEEEVEIEFLFPDQYERNLRSRRRRRSSTYAGNMKRDLEDDPMRGMRDMLRQKKAMASKSKTVELNIEDFKEVRYLQKLLQDDTIPEKISDLSEYAFDNKKFAPVEYGTIEYQDYNPPAIGINHPYMDRFPQYYDLFSSASSPSSTSKLDYTLQSAMRYFRLHNQQAAETPSNSTLTMEVVRSSMPSPEETRISDIFDIHLQTHPESLRFLQNNMKTYKQTQRGLPNALCMNDRLFVLGMSKSQVICFPRPHPSTLDPLMGDSSSTPSTNGGAGVVEEDMKPFTIGSHQSAEELGSVLSLSIDLSGQYIACGYSTGSVEILSVDKRASMKSLILHDTAVLFVRYLSNGNLLSVDYDGNVSVTVFTRKMFALSATTTKVLEGKAIGQVQDLSVLQFSVAVKGGNHGNNGMNGINGEGDSYEETNEGVRMMSVDLIALTTKDSTMILTMDSTNATVLFTLPRASFSPTKESPHYDEKSKSVQRVTCSAWRRGENKSFEFVRCDDELVEVWRIDTQLDANYHIKYYLKSLLSLRLSSVALSCSLLSSRYLLVLTQTDGFTLIDMFGQRVVKSLLPEGKLRSIYGNVNEKLQSVMRGDGDDGDDDEEDDDDDDEEEDDDDEGQTGKGKRSAKSKSKPKPNEVDCNNRLYTNCMIAGEHGLAVLCFDRLLLLEESDTERRFETALSNSQFLEALTFGTAHAMSLHQSMMSASTTRGVTDGMEEEEGASRLRYYSFVNRLSTVILQFAETTSSLPPEFICGCCFDCLTQINRSDLLFSSVQAVCDREHNGLSHTLFLKVLMQYVLAGVVTHLPSSLISELFTLAEEMDGYHHGCPIEGGDGVEGGDGIEGVEGVTCLLYSPRPLSPRLSALPRPSSPRLSSMHRPSSPPPPLSLSSSIGRPMSPRPSSPGPLTASSSSSLFRSSYRPRCHHRYDLDLAFSKLTAENTEATLSVLKQHNLLLAYTAIAAREKGAYADALPVVYTLLQSDQNLDYFCHYPAILSPEECERAHLSEGKAHLIGYFLFLLQMNIFGMSLTGIPLNNLARCANQGDCFRFLRQRQEESPENMPLAVCVKNASSFFLGLCFFALTVKVFTESTMSELEEKNDDDGITSSSSNANRNRHHTHAHVNHDDDDDEEEVYIDKAEEEQARLAVENEGLKSLSRITNDEVAACLVWIITHLEEVRGDRDDKALNTMEEEVRSLLYLFMESNYSAEIPPAVFVDSLRYLTTHSHCLHRSKLGSMLVRYLTAMFPARSHPYCHCCSPSPSSSSSPLQTKNGEKEDQIQTSTSSSLNMNVRENDHMKEDEHPTMATMTMNEEDVWKQIIAHLLSLGCLAECVQVLEHAGKSEMIMTLLLQLARGDEERGEEVWKEAEQYLVRSITRIGDNRGELANLAAHLFPLFDPLLYWNSSIAPYYLLTLCDGDHPCVLTQLSGKSVYLYLRCFLLNEDLPKELLLTEFTETMAASMSVSSMAALVKKAKMTIDEEVLTKFAMSVMEYDRERLGEFLQMREIPEVLAKTLLPHLNRKTDRDSWCILQARVGAGQEALHRLDEEYEKTSEMMTSLLRNVFSVKDMEPVFTTLHKLSKLSHIYGIVFAPLTQSLTFADIESNYIANSWRAILFSIINVVAVLRHQLVMKTELNANKKVIASLELCEQECGNELQRVLDLLQRKIPLSVLLECVLDRNANSTVKDLSGIINKVINTLQSEIKNYTHFVSIYRGDYNHALQKKVAAMKRPVKARFSVCVECGEVVVEGDSLRVFTCGHICHATCHEMSSMQTNENENENENHVGCQLCMNASEEVKKAVKLEALPQDLTQLSILNNNHYLNPTHASTTNDNDMNDNDMNDDSTTSSPQSLAIKRWRLWKQSGMTANQNTLQNIYETNHGEFMKLLEPLAMFSAVPEEWASECSGGELIGQIDVNELPIRPAAKGECLLLPQADNLD